MRYARIYPWRRTRRSRAPSNGPDAFFVAQFSAGYTTNMFGFDLRQGQVLGLRPFSAKAEILPEQVIGRGLRLMPYISPDRTQTLEVLGTRNLLNVLRTQLEAEGVGFSTTKTDPPRPVVIEPVQERL